MQEKGNKGYRPLNEKQRCVFAQKAKYKLLVYFMAGSGNNGANKPKVFFSREKHDKHGDMGEKELIRLVNVKYTGKYRTALIYDNLTGALLHKWVFNGVIEDKRL